MKKLLLPLILFFAFVWNSNGQSHSTLEKKSAFVLKNEWIDRHFFDVNLNSTDVRVIIDSIDNKYRETGDKEYLAFKQFTKVYNRLMVEEKNSLDFLEKVKTDFAEYPNLQLRGYNAIAFSNFTITKKYELAFDAYILMEEVLNQNSHKEIYGRYRYCGEIASAYYKFKDFKKAILMAKKGVAVSVNKWDLYNTIGLSYRELKQLDSSTYYLGKAVAEAKRLGLRTIYTSISEGNIGINFYLKKQYREAIPLLERDRVEALKEGDWGLAAGASIPLAHIYLQQHKMIVADSLLKQSRDFISKTNQVNRLEYFYPVRSQYYEKLGNYELALKYRDSSMMATMENDSIYNSLLLKRVQQKVDMAKIEQERLKLDNYRDLTKTRYIAIGAILVLILVGAFLFRRYNNRLKRNRDKINELNRVIDLRQRLSADMHDDIGSSLSSISLYTHSLLLQPHSDNQKTVLKKIKENAQYIQDKVNDIIWSVNPVMDVMSELIARMRRFGADTTESVGITFEFESEEVINTLEVEMGLRRNLYLMYKEIINNALKYSEASKIFVSLNYNEPELIIRIEDNGIGFDEHAIQYGNGLKNLKSRAKSMQATYTLKTEPGLGTQVTISVTLNKPLSTPN